MTMGEFDVVEYGYNIADETINFGTRQLADGDNLYEVATLASFKCSDGEGKQNPYIRATNANGKVYFSVNTCMRIFTNTQCSDLAFSATFPSIVDTFCVSHDGKYLLICLRDGTLNLVDCNNEFECIFKTACARDDESDRFFINAFITDYFIIITKLGQVFTVSTTENSFEMKLLHEFHFRTATAAFRFPFLLVSGTKLAVHNLRKGSTVSDAGREFINICPIDFTFVALDCYGLLFKVCAVTLLVLPMENSTPYKQVQILSDSSHQQILALTNVSDKNFIQMLSYPDLAIIYSVEVGTEIETVSLEFLHEEILFISNIASASRVSELRFCVVYETAPELRFRRLLKRRKYEEAEKLAKMFQLDASQIRKAKAQDIVDQETPCTSAQIDELVRLLDTIDDDEFKLECCMNVDTPDLRDIKKVLDYGSKLQVARPSEKFDVLHQMITRDMFKFDTFVVVCRTSDEDTTWSKFCSCDLVDEVKKRLRCWQIEEATIIYGRLDERTVEKLTPAQVAEILDILNNMPIATYQPFLPTFIPTTLSAIPSTLPLFVKWIKNRVFYLEKRDVQEYPSNAIRFTESVVGFMTVHGDTDLAFEMQRVVNRESFVELTSMLSALKMLRTLKNQFNFCLPLSECLAGPQNVVRLLLQIEMSTEDYEKLLNDFLYKYMLQNRMESNTILLEEIKHLMDYEEKYWVNVIGSILKCISCVDVKLEAIISLLKVATVPWNGAVRKIAYDAIKYSHVATSIINELIDDEPTQIVLRKPAYQIRYRKISNLEFTISRIIYCQTPTMIEDIYTLCNNPSNRHVANMLLIRHFIHKGEHEKALKILDNNEPDEIMVCLRKLSIAIEHTVNNTHLPDEMRNNYYQLSRVVFKRLNAVIVDKFQQICNDNLLDEIQIVHKMRTYFNIDTTTHKLRRTESRNNLIDDIVQEAFRKFKTNAQTPDEIFTYCHNVSTVLHVDPCELMMKFCRISGDYDTIVKTAHNVYESETSPKILCTMAVLLLKYAGRYKVNLNNSDVFDLERSIALPDSPDVNGEVEDVSYKCLELVPSLVGKAICRAKLEELAQCLALVPWGCMVRSQTLKPATLSLKRRLFGDVYDSGAVASQFSSCEALQKVFDAFSNFIGDCYNNPDNDYLTSCKDGVFPEEEFSREINFLSSAVNSLGSQGQQLVAYQLVDILQSCLGQVPQFSPSILGFLNGLLRETCTPNLMSAVVSSRNIDDDLLYNLLLSCEVNKAVNFVISSIRMYKRHPRKLEFITRVGLRYWKLRKLANGKPEMLATLTTIKWWRRFAKKQFEYDNFFKMSAIGRLEMLIDAECMDMESVREYGTDYALDVEACFKIFFLRLLQNWKPDYQILEDVNERILVVKNDETSLLAKCRQVMSILDGTHVFITLKNLHNSINPYYHEVFITLLHILKDINSKQEVGKELNMLAFLKLYRRVGPPGETEIEQWYTHFPDAKSLDVLSEFRLPFTRTLCSKQIFSIIKPEVNLKTYMLWFGAIHVLQPHVTTNEICSYAVKDVVASGVLEKGATNAWALFPKYDDLFKKIDECVAHIDDLELTTSVVYHLMTHTPPGADQVTAAKLCYKYATEFKKLNPDSEDAHKAFVKVQKKFYMFWVMHILHTHGLAERKYLNLLTRPQELIVALYSDERVWRRNGIDLECPDINKATEEVAEFFGLDLKAIRFTLVHDWLNDNNAHFVDFDASVVVSENEVTSDNNLRRVAYVCSTDKENHWDRVLLHMGMQKESEAEISVHCKARALKVLTMIVDASSIEALTDISYAEFIYTVNIHTIISNMQYLGINLSVTALEDQKKELLNRLVQRASNSLAIKTMGLICMTFKLYAVNYWKFIINTAIKFSLCAELKSYVYFLKSKYHLIKTVYTNAWQKLMDHSFTHLSGDYSLDETLCKNFLMIQTCPVLYSLDFNKVFEQCIQRGKVEFAAVLLQYFEDSKRTVLVKKVQQLEGDVATKLNKLLNSGIWGIAYVKILLTDSPGVNCK